MVTGTNDDRLVQTFDALQRIEPGTFHRLGDRLLPHGYPSLAGLRPLGVNPEGKGRHGVPDSFVGGDSSTCRAAVEYTTTKEGDLLGKLRKDYKGVRETCPKATYIVLCTSRSTNELDLSAIYDDARGAGIEIEVVDGWAISRLLSECHQDLRFVFLGIPIRSHTAFSLIGALRENVVRAAGTGLPANALSTYLSRSEMDSTFARRLDDAPSRPILVVAEAGAGKTTWSAASAIRYAGAVPVLWIAASDLALEAPDPIAIAIVQAAYGTPDPGRVTELADLLQRNRLCVRVFVDGLDEAARFADMDRALRVFNAGALGARTQLVLLCRDAAVPALEPALGRSFPELFAPNSEARLHLPELSDTDAHALLERRGADPAQVRAVMEWLPPRYRANPLFLVHALTMTSEGSLPAAGQNVIDTIVRYLVKGICQRLASRGAGPTEIRVRQFLEGLALSILRGARQHVRAAEVASMPDGGVDGENTILGRSVLAGILLRLGDGSIAFSHALFLEYFAAGAVDRIDSDETKYELASTLATACGGIAAGLASSLTDPNPWLRALLAHDPVTACDAASQASGQIDVGLVDELLAAVRQSLRSRFPSDRRRALRALSSLPRDKAVPPAISWWNDMPGDQKGAWLDEAAELFLTLQVRPAVHIVCVHPNLVHPAGWPWYEPSFVRKLNGLSEPFRTRLRDHAREALDALSPDDRTAGPLMTLLGMLRDMWLLTYLGRWSSRKLPAEAHRALIQLNVPEAIDILAGSVDIWLESIEGTTDGGEKEELWDHVVIRGADIAMFPHGQLLELVKGALDSARPLHVRFGLRWAEVLEDPELLASYATVRERLGEEALFFEGRMFESIVRRASFSAIRDLFERSSASARRQIAQYLHEAPGQDMEEFLIALADDPEFRFSAIQSLGKLRAVRAGPTIRRWAREGDLNAKHMALRALGRLRYLPALPDLIHDVRGLLARRKAGEAETQDRNLEFLLIRTVGQIGRGEGRDLLEELAFFTTSATEVYRAILRQRSPESVASVGRLLSQRREHLSHVIAALVLQDVEDWQVHARGRIRPWITDMTLLSEILVETREMLQTGRASRANNPLLAVAQFDLPSARTFLEDLAQGEPIVVPPAAAQPSFDPTLAARLVLSELGDRRYSRDTLDRTLHRLADSEYVGESDLRELRAWPSALVREALLDCLGSGNRIPLWLSLLRRYALAEDRGMFEKFEGGHDNIAADVAHSYLRAV